LIGLSAGAAPLQDGIKNKTIGREDYKGMLILSSGERQTSAERLFFYEARLRSV